MFNSETSNINLNDANESTLIKELKIDRRLARRIISLRPFDSIDKLDNIWGIDEDTLHRIKSNVYIGEIQEADDESILTTDHTFSGIQSSTIESPNKVDKEEGTTSSKQEISQKKFSWKTNLILLLILFFGAIFRFTGINWDENFHQQPDERFMTMVAEKIRGVDSVSAYFDTENSTLNPIPHGFYTYGMLPLFVTRAVAVWAGMDTYNQITLVGRFMSGLFDLAAVWVLFILAKRLYGKKVALLAAALGAAAVLPIQLSHYFAVDSFATVFILAAFYFIFLAIPIDKPDKKLTENNYLNFIFFGIVVGMAAACKVNTLPVLGMIFLAGFIYLLLLWKKPGFRSALGNVILGCLLAVLFTFLSFRVFQPYAFSGPEFTNFSFNTEWVEIIQKVSDQVAGNSEWPPNHHWTNRPITYAWTNMVVWGMGIPLGLTAWIGWLWAGWQIWKGDWRKHLIPFVWVGAYFIWQNMQFWRYMRYFIPIYPFLIMFAAWAAIEVYKRNNSGNSIRLKSIDSLFTGMNFKNRSWKQLFSISFLIILIVSTYGYAFAFTRIYTRPITRVEASRWIFANIPGPFNLMLEDESSSYYPLPVFNHYILEPERLSNVDLKPTKSLVFSSIYTPNIEHIGAYLNFRITRDEDGDDLIREGYTVISDSSISDIISIDLGDFDLEADRIYYLHYRINAGNKISFSDLQLKNKDDGSPILSMEWGNNESISGKQEGVLIFQPEEAGKYNCLVINGFSQEFVPAQAKIKISIFENDENKTLLAESIADIDFMQSGEIFDHNFKIPRVKLEKNIDYQIQYEVIEGTPLRLSGESFTLETSWDDSLPLAVDGHSHLSSIYTPLNLELYEADTPEKREKMLQMLDQAEYIVIPSNRSYDAMPRLELRYPLTLKYYQILFDCDCSGDDLEKKAYGLQPPFNSPLGFDLIAVFESYPNLGPITFRDQTADESFTVYDHPKVFIFKKSKNFSADHINTVLNSVNLDLVEFQVPKNYSKAQTALRMPEDRLKIQTSSGTWSQIFNRNSLQNRNEIFAAFLWYLLILLLGWIFLPATWIIFKGLPDKGYSALRLITLILITWTVWFSGNFKILPFTRLSIVAIIAFFAVVNLYIAYRYKEELKIYLISNWKYILIVEVLFLSTFLFSLLIRVANPDLWHPWYGGEKPMDFAIFNSVIKSQYFPPINPWFSGYYLNYYYYGFIIAAIPTKLIGILPSIAYNLVLPTWFAMTAVGIFGVIFNILLGLKQKTANDQKTGKRISNFLFTERNLAYFAGLLGVVFILFAGNYYPLRLLWKYLPEVSALELTDNSIISQFKNVMSGATQVLSGEEELPGPPGRWYFDPTRPILSEGPDTPIAEFPYFTYLYGDMHPHLLAMPFFVLPLLWIAQLIINLETVRQRNRIIIYLLSAGIIFGSFRAMHTWDYPVLIALGAITLAYALWKTGQPDLNSFVKKTLILIIAFVTVTLLFYAPYFSWFKSGYMSVELWKGMKTPFSDYLFVFTLPIFFMGSLSIRELLPTIKILRERWNYIKFDRKIILFVAFIFSIAGIYLLWKFGYQVLAIGFPFVMLWVYFIFFKDDLSFFQKLIWCLFAIGFSLTFLVEVIVLKGDVGRANMVFRMYNEAWFFLGFASALSVIDMFFIRKSETIFARVGWGIFTIIFIAFSLTYPLIATEKKMNDRWPGIENPSRTLDGSKFLAGTDQYTKDPRAVYYTDEGRKINIGIDYGAIQYIQDRVIGSPVIVEGVTPEYRWGTRYAIHTGLPTVIGWNWHVRQHNSLIDTSIVEKRTNEVKEFYETTDINSALDFLNKYQVRYIIVSSLERAYYDPNGFEKFNTMTDQGLMGVIYEDEENADQVTIYQVVNQD